MRYEGVVLLERGRMQATNLVSRNYNMAMPLLGHSVHIVYNSHPVMVRLVIKYMITGQIV